MEADGIDRGHAHPSGDLLMKRPDLVLEGVIAGDQLAAAVEEHLPFARRHQRPLRPFDQCDAEPVLELTDHLAGAGLRNLIVLGGAGKAPPDDNVAEYFEGFEVHADPSRRGSRSPGHRASAPTMGRHGPGTPNDKNR